MLLIDGYNVLHTPMPPALAGLDTASLCRALARTPWRRGPIVVVCDGQAGPLGLLESPVEAVELVYAGRTRIADDVIIEQINAATAPRRLIVVSSDHEIRQAARRRRARSWTSEQFLHELLEALRRGPAAAEPEKPAPDPLSPRQVDDWLETFGYEAGPSDPDDPDDEDDDDARYWPPR
ncbi:MAG: NYN domain-containing protein [Phycisphaeraceae bacterium]